MGIDIRTLGSRTTGAFNVARALNAPGFFITLAGDSIKGAAAIGLSRTLGVSELVGMLVLIAVVLGHDFPFQLGFRGGNGLAAAGGALLVYDPSLALALAVFFCVSLPVLWIGKVLLKAPVRYYTPSKLTVIAAPLMAMALGREGWLVLGLGVLVVVILTTIRSNLRNLARGD